MNHTVQKEILAARKFGEFAAKLILAKENLANLPILRLKVILQNSSIIFVRNM